MKLTNAGLQNKQAWRALGYETYEYNREEVVVNTKKRPQWIHFGAGNIFRAFPVHLCDYLIAINAMDTGIIVAEGYDMEILDKAYQPYDNLSILATLTSDAQIRKKILGGISESLHFDTNHEDYKRLLQVFKPPSLQLATFTITEKGYQLCDAQNSPLPILQTDLLLGPDRAQSYIAKLTALLYARYCADKLPIALVSLDNCSNNGEKLAEAVMSFAQGWNKNKFVDNDFLLYLCDEEKVSFPITMIDKITPRPCGIVMQALDDDQIEDIALMKTSRGTYVAPFVNAEEAQYLIIEDKFPNGRPCLERAGVYFCEKEVVHQVERMKVCTCLNPLHTALAIFGCLFHYATIYECMQDSYLKVLIEGIGYGEGLRVARDPMIIHPKDFIDEVIQKRLVNPFMPDTPQRIVTDTSLKIGIRFGTTIKEYEKDKKLDVSSLKYIPFVFAGWCRYLLGVDDEGNTFSCSDDPSLTWLQDCLKEVRIGEYINVHKVLKPILANIQIFQVDLYKLHIAEQVETYFEMMICKKGAVKECLVKLNDILISK